jgi:hypothetical protein
MDIDQLMSLQQGGEGGAKGGLEEKNAKKTGAAIANGALQQDIANEGARLAADLAHQEAMMKEEQKQRKGMLFIEQAQRLQNLAIEAKWRIKYAKEDSEEALAVAVKEMQVESASKLANNLFQDSAQTFKDNLTKQGITPDSPKFQEAMTSFNANTKQSQEYVMGLVQQGILSADNSGMVMADIAQKVANGEQLTKDGVNKMLTDQGAFYANEKKIQDEKVALQAKMDALALERNEKEAGFWEDIGDSLLDGITFGFSTTDEENDKITEDFDKKQNELDAAMKSIDAQLKTAYATTDAASADTFAPVTAGLSELKSPLTDLKPVADNTYTATAQMMKDADTRGMVFKKQYDYQAKVSNETTKATYAVAAAVELLANAQGKPINLDTSGVASAINRLSGLSYAKAQ